MPDDEYFNFQNVNNEIVERSLEVVSPSFTQISNEINNAADLERWRKLYLSEASKTQYIAFKGKRFGQELIYPKKANIFKPIFNSNSTDIDIELKIVPAPMRVVKVPVLTSIWFTELLYHLETQMPVVDINPLDEDIEEPLNIQEAIENEMDFERSSTSDNIRLVFYTGFHTIYKEDEEDTVTVNKVDYPVPFVDYFWEIGKLGERIISQEKLTLRLDHPDGMKRLYDSVNVDTTREYTFRFLYPGKIDAKSIFVFNNKEFVCKQFQYIVSPLGIEDVIEGIFYPMN